MKTFLQYNESMQTYTNLRKAADSVQASFKAYVRNDGKYGDWGPNVSSGFDHLRLFFKTKSDMDSATKKIQDMGFDVNVIGKDDSMTKSKRQLYFPGKKVASEKITDLWVIEVKKIT